MRLATVYIPALAAAPVLAVRSPAAAYDTGPHSEITRDALTRSIVLSCFGGWTAAVDDLNQVEETDETDNTRGQDPVIC